ncbi:hypothetical protein [Rathayibacter soli]|uniref:hypothetical protein n=1 Tax=Rathayibacter soli TaxID=3144168 RepID=UPI0027E4EFE8|nr:hypothetical protein [Glaciibacter superstes]
MPEFNNAIRLTAAGLAVACLLVLTACTGAGVTAAPTRTAAVNGAGAGGSGALPGYRQATKDQLSPLIITTLAPAPIPVKGSDNKFHVAYELSVFNDAPRDATMTKMETIAGNDRGKVIATLDQEQVAGNTILTGDYSPAMLGSTDIPAGRAAIIVLRDVYPTKKSVPATFTHRISATLPL